MVFLPIKLTVGSYGDKKYGVVVNYFEMQTQVAARTNTSVPQPFTFERVIAQGGI